MQAKLTIALDAEHTRRSRAGIARYARGLETALRGIPDLHIIVLGGGGVVARGTPRQKLLTVRQDLLWYPWLGRKRAGQLRANVYHSPLLRGPFSRGRPPLVMTVHDLVPLRWPETMSRWNRFYTSRFIARMIDAADRIITPSQDTADDINALLRVAPKSIRVAAPNGVDEQFFLTPAGPPLVTKPYVLFVGTPEPRKNLKRLIAAMTMLRARGFLERLVVVGAGGWGGGIDSEPGIQRTGRVSDDELRVLYANATCLALPSLHEGFGLPALEAMASGTPVVAGNSGALPEVTGGAAVLVDPQSVTAIADGIERAVADKDRLAQAGRARARAFSWERTAALTAEVYRELA